MVLLVGAPGDARVLVSATRCNMTTAARLHGVNRARPPARSVAQGEGPSLSTTAIASGRSAERIQK